MNISTLIGLIGSSLLLCVIFLWVARIVWLQRILKFKTQASYILIISVFIVSFIPVSGYTINLYIRALINDLSITSLIVMLTYLLFPQKQSQPSDPSVLLIFISGLFFYPATLGLSAIDPYSWGFFSQNHGSLAPFLFIIILAGLMAIAAFKQYTLMLACLALSVLAYQLELLESKNIWDYLFDPVIFIYATFALLSAIIKKYLKLIR